jgi:hypothetical protein
MKIKVFSLNSNSEDANGSGQSTGLFPTAALFVEGLFFFLGDLFYERS